MCPFYITLVAWWIRLDDEVWVMWVAYDMYGYISPSEWYGALFFRTLSFSVRIAACPMVVMPLSPKCPAGIPLLFYSILIFI